MSLTTERKLASLSPAVEKSSPKYPPTAASLVASIAQLIAITTRVVDYTNDINDAPKDRARLATDAASLLPCLTSLKYMIKEWTPTDPWFVGVRSLGVKKGPLDRFKEAMETLAEKLKPRSDPTTFGTKLLWTLDKKELGDPRSDRAYQNHRWTCCTERCFVSHDASLSHSTSLKSLPSSIHRSTLPPFNHSKLPEN